LNPCGFQYFSVISENVSSDDSLILEADQIATAKVLGASEFRLASPGVTKIERPSVPETQATLMVAVNRF